MAQQVIGKVSIIPCGEFQANTRYSRLSVVSYQGSSYIAISDNENTPVSDTSVWYLLAAKGDQGEQGIQGEQGEKGDTYEVTQEDLDAIAAQITSDASSAFNQNVTQKTNDFNDNATSKTNDFNSNATSKTNDFNSNATNKTNDFNDNATNKTNDFDSHVDSELEYFNDGVSGYLARLNDLETLASNVNTNLANGQNFELEDALNGKAKLINPVIGQHSQDTSLMTYKCSGSEEGDYYFVYNDTNYQFTMPTVTSSSVLVFDTIAHTLKLGTTTITTTEASTGTLIELTEAPNQNYAIPVNVVTGDTEIDIQNANYYTPTSAASSDGWYTVSYDNSASASAYSMNFYVNNSNLPIEPSTPYAVVLEVRDYSSQLGNTSVYVTSLTSSTSKGQFPAWRQTDLANGIYINVMKSNAESSWSTYGLRSYVSVGAGDKVHFQFRISVLMNTDVTIKSFQYTSSTSQNYSLTLGSLEFLNGEYIYGTTDNWYKHQEWAKIASYNGETITTDYISTTGALSTGATVYYKSTSEVAITDATLVGELNTIYANLETYKNSCMIKITSDNLTPSISFVYDVNDMVELRDVEETIDNINDRVGILENKAGKAYTITRVITDNSSPAWTRGDDAVGLTATARIASSTPVTNDFDNIYPWCDIKDCNVDADGNPTYFIGETNFDPTDEVYVYIPRHWVMRKQYYDDENNLIEKITVYDYPAQGATEIKPYCVGKYALSMENGIAVSKTGLVPTTSTTRATFRTNARRKGANFGLLDWRIFDLRMLYLVEYANYNSQTMVGNGNTNLSTASAQATQSSVNRIIVNSVPTGIYVGKSISIGTASGNYSVLRDRTVTSIEDYSDETLTNKKAIYFDGAAANITTGNVIWGSPQKGGDLDSFGNTSGCLVNDSYHSVTWRGIDNPWGNVNQHVDGISIDNYLTYVCYDPALYDNDVFTNPYLPLSYTNATTSDSYIKEVGYDENNPFIAMPIVVGGSSTTYVCDNYWCNSDKRIMYTGGSCNNNGVKCGFCTTNCYSPSTNTNWNNRSSPTYSHQLIRGSGGGQPPCVF